MKAAKRILAVLLAIAIVWTGIPFGAVNASYNGEMNPEAGSVQEEATEPVEEESAQGLSDLQQSLPKPEQALPESVQSLPEPEQALPESVQSVTQEPAQEATAHEKIRVDYLVTESSYISAPGLQRIVVGVGEDGDVVETAALTYLNEETQERFTVPMERAEGGAILFSIDFAEGQAGTYLLESLEYTMNGVVHSGSFKESGIETRFGVEKEVKTDPDAVIVDQEEITADIVTVDENGQVNSQNSIAEAIDEARSNIGTYEKRASGNVVVVLDPGHDNTHAGAQHNGLGEEKLNLKIAKYCKEALEQYAGVTVYLTRPEDGSCPHPGTSSLEDLSRRVAYAKSVGAHVYVSLHLNAYTSSQPNGAEVYYPNGNYDAAVGAAGGQLADRILEKLGALGLNVRGKQIHDNEGLTYPDGSAADDYRVIREGKLAGIPAIIVEHAFMTNTGDVNRFLKSEDGLRSLGVADAEGIAAYFGLQKKSALQLNGIFYTEKDGWIEAGVSWQSASPSVQFRWLSYSMAKGTWNIVSDWSARDYITWKPEKGQHILRVEAQSSQGAQRSWEITYTSKRDYTRNYVDVSGIFYIEAGDGIHAGAVHTTNDAATEFRWLQYNADKGTWTILQDWKRGESIVWRPGIGNYWLKAEARTSDGGLAEAALVYHSSRDYEGERYLKLNGIFYVETGNGISAAVSYEPRGVNTEFRWMEYNVAKGTWRILSNWSKRESITWKPEAGPHWLRVDARTSNGIERESAISYTSKRDYNRNYVDIEGIYYTEDMDGIHAGAVHKTDDKGTQFRWLVYDTKKGTWSIISDWKKSEWVTWKPVEGSYWLRAEARTSDGIQSSSTIEYHMVKYAIMGTSATTVEKMAAYYKDRYTYPAFYANSEAPTIEDFCRIYFEECAKEGVKAEVAFCQSMKETGFLQYPGASCVVSPSQYNFAGLDTTGAILEDGSIDVGRSYSGVREGIRAHVQRLKAYAAKGTTPESYAYPCIDSDKFASKWWRDTIVGSSPYVEWLGKSQNPSGFGWATDPNYGYSIRNDYLNKLLRY